MLHNNIFNKLIGILLILFILTSLCSFFIPTEVKAAYSSEFSKYPGYEALLKNLIAKHPNWEFELYDTGLDWSEAIIGESTAHHGLNVVPKSKGGAWQCICGKIVEDVWTCASTAAVEYYMDPRNSLNETYVFQFEQLTYDSNTHTKAGVEAILKDCKYLQGNITYYDTAGKQQTINKTYIDVIMEAAKECNISPYHLASRIRQEQGTTGSVMITGKYSGYEGYYNYYNIGAYGKDVIGNGLSYAKKKNWTNPELAIKGGAKLIVSDYISVGQDTLYFQKFDVTPQSGYFSWQYMTNISASKSEGAEIGEAYKKINMANSRVKFKVPVYKNMPATQAPEPGLEKVVTEDVQINANSVMIREGKGTNYKAITSLNKGTKLVRIEQDYKKDANGRYWDKVVLSNGTKGYVSRQYLTSLSLQSNANASYVVKSYTNLRNGPGTTSTTVLKVLAPGQTLTVVETGKYSNVNGEAWYRVKLSDGTYGYVGTSYIQVYDASKMNIDTVKVVCKDGLNIRKSPNTSSAVLKAVEKGTLLTRTEQNVSGEAGYIWDKVTTSSGVSGYVVRQDPKTKQAWIESTTNTSNNTNVSTSQFKTQDSNLVAIPDITVSTVKATMKDAVIKNGTTVVADTAKLGTGYTITSGGKTYTIIVLGDVNGDGNVNTGDTLCMSQHIEDFKKITNSNYIKAADVNKDGTVNTGDSLALRQHVENFKNIVM